MYFSQAVVQKKTEKKRILSESEREDVGNEEDWEGKEAQTKEKSVLVVAIMSVIVYLFVCLFVRLID